MDRMDSERNIAARPGRRPGFRIVVSLIRAGLVAGLIGGLAAAPAALAQDTAPEAELMVADLILARPLGLVSIVVGTAAFFVSLPFTLPSNSTGAAAEQLIGGPLRYTFDRPLGEFRTPGRKRKK